MKPEQITRIEQLQQMAARRAERCQVFESDAEALELALRCMRRAELWHYIRQWIACMAAIMAFLLLMLWVA